MRTVAVASGKGGTGKTTLTALFASLAARTGSVVLADCDVEAANLPIALGATVQERTPFAGAGVAVIEPAGCLACGMCVQVCRFGAIFQQDQEAQSFIPTIAYSVDPMLCEGCGACLQVSCPSMVISMQETVAGDLVVGESATGPMVFGELSPGEDLSGKLVTQVRTTASRIAQESGADLVLVDGPPGVGCPVIAALASVDVLVAVTEPTLSGEHDLLRLVTLARRLETEIRVVLNKADLSEPGAQGIRDRCAAEDLPLLGEVPFDPDLALMLDRLAEGASVSTLLAEGGAGIDAVIAVWEALGAAPC